jgi:hypothetical protein
MKTDAAVMVMSALVKDALMAEQQAKADPRAESGRVLMRRRNLLQVGCRLRCGGSASRQRC